MKIYKEEQRKSNHATKNKGQVWHRCTTVTFDLSFSPLCLLMTVCEFEGEDGRAVYLTLTCPIFPGLFVHADTQHCS